MSLVITFLANATDTINAGANAACAGTCNTTSLPNVFKAIANTLIFLVGAISVIMILIGGFRYVISRGDPKNTTDARNTILYALIGVVVAIAAYAMVAFVTKSIK